MKTLEVICFAALFSLVTSFAAQAQTILVDNNKANCPTATFSEIQPAIDSASPGETIRVCAGVYQEQLTIAKSITLAGDNGAVLMPTAMTANATSASTSDQIAAAIVVKNTTNVIVSGLYIDGSGNGITICAPRLIGILVQDASATIRDNAVRHFRLPAAPGCQSGNGIEVETITGSSVVTLSRNSVDDYQKNGITANETGTTATITQNFVSGIGPTTGAAQNGIQVGFGAAGIVESNTVSNNIWSPCSSLADCSTNATGVLVFGSDNVQVVENNIGTNQIGVFSNGTNSLISSNQIFNSLVLDGIAIGGNASTIQNNEITQSDNAAVEIQGANNTITTNRFLAADIGILIDPGSSGTMHSANGFAAILTGVVAGSATPAAAAIVAAPKAASAAGASGANTKMSHRVSPSR